MSLDQIVAGIMREALALERGLHDAGPWFVGTYDRSVLIPVERRIEEEVRRILFVGELSKMTDFPELVLYCRNDLVSYRDGMAIPPGTFMWNMDFSADILA
jgi:hypothetical protein